MRILTFILPIAIFFTACNDIAKKENDLLLKQKSIDSLNAAIAKQKAIDSMNLLIVKQQTPIVQNNTTSTSPDPVKKKKGWSNTAKGAVIGLGTGAVVGAIVDKKHGEGAVVGGLIGAGAGAVTGSIIDKNKK